MTSSANKQNASSKPARGARTTKKDQLIKLLSARASADIASLSDKLGWQQHTARAAMSGLRKAGYEIAVEKAAAGGLSKYRILSAPAAEQVAAAAGATDGA